MTGRFDENGDLWIEVRDLERIPTGVETSRFVKSLDMGLGLGVAATEINLTRYIINLIGRWTKK